MDGLCCVLTRISLQIQFGTSLRYYVNIAPVLFSIMYVYVTKGARRQVQGGALAVLHPIGFCFSVFCKKLPCTESDTETPTVSFLQSEIRQQVLVFYK